MSRWEKTRKFLRENFFSGLLVVVPLAGSLYVLVILSRWLYRKVVVYPLVPKRVLDLLHQVLPDWSEMWVSKSIHLVEFLVVVLALIFVVSLAGLVTRIRLVKWVLGIGERIFQKIPLIGVVYSALKQLLMSIFSGKGNFSRVVIVEFPRPGIWSLGFLSRETDHHISRSVTEEKLYTVFVPTTPNVTTGFLLLVPETELRFVDLSVEDAFKVILSGGLAQPEGSESGEKRREKGKSDEDQDRD